MSSRPPALSTFAALLALGLCGCSGTDHPTSIALVVSPIGQDSNPGTADAPLRSLKRALGVVAAGGAIRVEAGTYDASAGETWDYTVPAGVTISGDGAPQTILQAPAPDVASGKAPSALEAASKLRLEGVSLLGFDVAVNIGSPAHVSLRDVVMTGSGTAAVQVAETGAGTDLDVTGGSIDGGQVALELGACDGCKVSINGASIKGGVFVTGQNSTLTITASTIEGNTMNAAVNFWGDSLNLTDSDVRAGTAPYGISQRAGTVSLTNVTIAGGNYGLYQLAGKSTLRKTQISDYASIGLYYASGELDLGTATESGDNALTGRADSSTALGVYVDTGTAPVTSSNTSFDGVVPPAGTVQAGMQEIVQTGEYFITPGQSMVFFDAPEP